jgi:hypothetical protein
MSLSVKNFLMVGIMAVLFIILAKVLVNKYPALEPLSKPLNTV